MQETRWQVITNGDILYIICTERVHTDALGYLVQVNPSTVRVNSLGATCRRLWTGGIIRLPPDHGLPASLHVRAFLAVWAADGPAMGDICGTVTSFSKAINPCNRCEDLDRRDPEKLKPCGFLRKDVEVEESMDVED